MKKNTFLLSIPLIVLTSFSLKAMGSDAVVSDGSSIVYYQGDYPNNHWALAQFSLEQPKVIALATYKGSQYALYVNPTDRRCYRLIARLINNDNPKSVINRPYSLEETIGLKLFTALTEEAFVKLGLVPQTAHFGNNSHEYDANNNVMHVGTEGEPSFLHQHIWGRGIPEKTYIEGISLGGPFPGELLELRGTPSDPKIKCINNDMNLMVETFRNLIHEIYQENQDNFEGLDLVLE